MKTSVIRPIYKSGRVNDPGNYRSISILLSINKIVERVIVGQVTEYIQKTQVINKMQHGFQKGKKARTPCYQNLVMI